MADEPQHLGPAVGRHGRGSTPARLTGSRPWYTTDMSDATHGGPSRLFFDVWSRFYDLPAVQRVVYRPVQDGVVEALGEHDAPRVLDVGCGTGLLTARLSEEEGYPFVAGFDLSFGMLQQARGRSRRPAWVQGDSLHLPFPDGRFDAVVSTESLHWYPDQLAALRE